MKYKTKQQLEKQLFDTVYKWGQVGLITDEECNFFQDTLKEIKDLSDEEEEHKKTIEILKKNNVNETLPEIEIPIEIPLVLDKSIISQIVEVLSIHYPESSEAQKRSVAGQIKKIRIDELRKIDTFCDMPVNDKFYVDDPREDEEKEPEKCKHNWLYIKAGTILKKGKYKIEDIARQCDKCGIKEDLEEPEKIEPIPNNADYSKTEDDIVDKINEVIDFLNKLC